VSVSGDTRWECVEDVRAAVGLLKVVLMEHLDGVILTVSGNGGS